MIYIQTTEGLSQVTPSLTKEKIISALGYSPADELHVKDSTVHITEAERDAWNDKSDFSGNYADLEGAPSITDDKSDDLIISDESNNIILKVDADGLETTQVLANTVIVNGIDVETVLNDKADISHNHDAQYDAKGAANGVLSSAKSYTDSEIEKWVGDKTVATQIETALSGIGDPLTYDELEAMFPELVPV